MAKAKKKRFKFATRQLNAGSDGDDVRALQAFLSEAGYLRRDRDPGRMCECTCAALRHFQKCYGLPDTGDADSKTLSLMMIRAALETGVCPPNAASVTTSRQPISGEYSAENHVSVPWK